MTAADFIPQLFEHSAPYYDAVYAAKHKSYADEVTRLKGFVRRYGPAGASTLLDVACGTGEHLRFLATDFEVVGTDLSPQMLAVARQKLPDVPFHLADMRTLDLGEARFDVVTCLFSALGYLPEEAGLRQAVARMAAHLNPGGIVVLEPSLTPERVRPAATSTLTTHVGETDITRVTSAEKVDRVLDVCFDYTITDGAADETSFVEHHPMRLFPRELYLEALQRAGLEPAEDTEGISGIGLFLGVDRSRSFWE